jgi:hypothetical protein
MSSTRSLLETLTTFTVVQSKTTVSVIVSSCLLFLTSVSYIFFCAQDRPDLIKSELAGLAFDSLQQVFRKVDINAMFSTTPLEFDKDQDVFVIIDPAAGGPSSDYTVVSLVR